MNRTILYKGRRIDTGKWVEGYYLSIDEKAYIICEAEEQYIDRECIELYGSEWYEVNPDTICQYTGMDDKNGYKIWENDIVLYNNNRSALPIAVVKWETAEFKLYWRHDCDNNEQLRKDLNFWTTQREIQVIGNVYDKEVRSICNG